MIYAYRSESKEKRRSTYITPIWNFYCILTNKNNNNSNNSNNNDTDGRILTYFTVSS